MRSAIENSVKDILRLNIEENKREAKEKIDSNDVLYKIDLMKNKQTPNNSINKKYSAINFKTSDLNSFDNTALAQNEVIKLKLKDESKNLSKEYISSLNLSDRKQKNHIKSVNDIHDLSVKPKNISNLDIIEESRITNKNFSSKFKINKKLENDKDKEKEKHDILHIKKEKSSNSNSFKSDKSDSLKENKVKPKTNTKFRSSQFIAQINLNKIESNINLNVNKNFKDTKETTDVKNKKINIEKKNSKNDNRVFVTPKNSINFKNNKSVSNILIFRIKILKRSMKI